MRQCDSSLKLSVLPLIFPRLHHSLLLTDTEVKFQLSLSINLAVCVCVCVCVCFNIWLTHLTWVIPRRSCALDARNLEDETISHRIWVLHWFYLFYLFYFFALQYCIGFAIHQHESATGVHMFPLFDFRKSWKSLCGKVKHPGASARLWGRGGMHFK